MSKTSRQRLREEAKQQEIRLARRKKLCWILPLIVILLVGIGVSAGILLRHKPQVIAQTDSQFHQPQTLKELLALPPDQLDKVDIGLMNLLCAQGLPGAENLDVQACLKTLDKWAAYVKEETQRHYYRFREHPEDFKNSEGYFDMDMLGTILVQDLHIQYNPAIALPQLDGRIPTLGVASNSADMFIFGLLNGNHYGTCASMPVLYVAIGRRLGYPVDLVAAKYHYYVRYEDWNNKHFNVEATETQGFFTPPDDEYKNGQFPCTDEEIKGYGWLRPLTNKELLGHFLDTRGICLGDARRYNEAREMFIRSAACFPNAPLWQSNLVLNLKELDEAPLGDKIDDWRDEIKNWGVPQGPRNVYFENRKIQVRYFTTVCPDASASQRAVDDLKAELAEYARQMTLTNPAPEFLEHGQHVLDLQNKSGQELRTPAETLPPPLNNGTTPQDYLNCIANIDLQDEGAIMDALWQHYKNITTDWSNQPPLLPQHWQNMEITFPNLPLTTH